MKLVKFSDFMRLSLFFNRTIGLRFYTGGGGDATIYDKFNFFYGLFNLGLLVSLEIAYVLLAFMHSENFVEATIASSYIGFSFVGGVKVYLNWRQKLIISNFMQKMEDIFPKNLIQQRAYRAKSYYKRCQVVTQSFSGLYMVLIWTYNLMAIVQFSVYKWLLHSEIIPQHLPYLMFIPWDYQDHWSYFVLYVMNVYAGYTAATGHISSDLLLYAMSMQMIMHFDYVAQTLENYEVQAMNNENVVVEAGVRKDMHFLQDTIAYHEQLLSLTDTMNDVFGISLLLNFMTSSCVICFVGFQITIGAEPEILFKLTLFLISSTVQIFLICHFSQLLIDASFGIAAAAYSQTWFNADIRYKKMLILIFERAQKPAHLNATVVLPISRGTMTEIMQLSYKFFALLRTMYVK